MTPGVPSPTEPSEVSPMDRDTLLARLQAVTGEGAGQARVVRAPGRVNLIGEHTDYNDGYVLPAAIDLEMRIAYVPTDDGRVRLRSDATGEATAFDVADPGDRQGDWRDYVAGTAWAMA